MQVLHSRLLCLRPFIFYIANAIQQRCAPGGKRFYVPGSANCCKSACNQAADNGIGYNHKAKQHPGKYKIVEE